MNEAEIKELARLSNQLYYEIVEHYKPVSEGICGTLYNFIRHLSLTVLGGVKIQSAEDAMLRLLIVNETINLLARDLPQHAAELEAIGKQVEQFRTQYHRQVVQNG